MLPESAGCESVEETGREFDSSSQSTERARPKRQVAGESPAGDTILRLEPAQGDGPSEGCPP